MESKKIFVIKVVMFHAEAPVINLQEPAESPYYQINTSVRLTCSAVHGYPEPQITWQYQPCDVMGCTADPQLWSSNFSRWAYVKIVLHFPDEHLPWAIINPLKKAFFLLGNLLNLKGYP